MTDEQFNREQIERLNKRLREYLDLSCKTTEEVVSKKGNDLRISMFQKFKEHRWGGTSGSKGIAVAEWRARGYKIKVRKSLLAKARGLKPKKHVNAWARAVGMELKARQRGIGVLGASFLVRRWDSKRRKLIVNTTGRKGRTMLAEFAFDAHPISDSCEYTATGYRPGLDVVSGRYHIASMAMSEVSADMEKYIKRKQEEAMRKTVSDETH